jgi:flagellar biosynthesis protein FlhF
MKIKRFFAQDMRQAIRKVEKELGPDAVILSNKNISGGVELVAAIDFDEALFGKEFGATPPQAPQSSPPPKSPQTAPAPVEPPIALREDKVSLGAMAQPPSAPAPRADANFWSQEPTLVEIRKELNDLRGLLERQLSGFAWGDEARRHPARAQILRELAALGLTPELSRAVSERVPDDLGAQGGWIKALELLAAELPTSNDDVVENGGIVALVGPTGVGKTTTIAKLAARYALRHGRKRIALVTIDNYRIGAHEQLRTYGRIMDVPVYTVKSAQEMRGALDDLCEKHLVLIDTAGMSQRDKRVAEQFAILDAAKPALKSYLVLSATTQAGALHEIVQAYKGNALHGCIVTKLDESAQLGGAFSAAISHRLPVVYVSDGQRVPEDIHVARSRNLVQRAAALARGTGQCAVDDGTLENAFRGAVLNANV